MKFSSYFDKNFIFCDLEGTSKQEIIKNMIDKIALKDKIIDSRKEEIKTAVIKREMEISTAIGKGIGIPHGRITNYNDVLVAVGILKTPFKIEIEGTKQEDTLHVVFLIISDAIKNKTVLKLMSAISKIALKQDWLLEKIKNATTSKEILDAITETNFEFENKIVASDVLSPDIIPVKPNSNLSSVANRLITEKISGIPVVDEDNNFLGEITERELIGFGMPKYTNVMDNLNFLTAGEPFEEYLLQEETCNINDIYRKKDSLCIIDKETPIMEICFAMVSKGAVRIYVVEDGKYLGVINRSDIIKKVLHI